jgi:FdrA protein
MNREIYIRSIFKQGEYYDSVSLMRLAQKLREMPGVIDSAAIMGSEGNKAILESAGMLPSDLRNAAGNDLLIVIKTDSIETANRFEVEIETYLAALRAPEKTLSGIKPRSIEAALKELPDANLALISVAGEHAASEAWKALHAGLNVMIFSDNVSLDDEIELKKYAVDKNLLVMGPDCGTAIINGIPLGFANAVGRGDIGIVAASGTGLQEVCCIISQEGAGISQAIGTGSRDISEKVGGLMFIEGIKALADDEGTSIILLISKPPHNSVQKKISAMLKNITKPNVTVFLGANQHTFDQSGCYFASSLEEGAITAVALSKGQDIFEIRERLIKRDAGLIEMAKAESRKFNKEQRYVRGLFSGGTFCYEAQVILQIIIGHVYSNTPIGNNLKLTNVLKSEGHTLIDMGANEFTVGRLHPMIDFSLRNKRFLQEARDAETAILLFDLVLGYGANENPLAEIMPVIEECQNIAKKDGRYLSVICSVTGTDRDPQNRSIVIDSLINSGVIVTDSNAAASKLTGLIISETMK